MSFFFFPPTAADIHVRRQYVFLHNILCLGARRLLLEGNMSGKEHTTMPWKAPELSFLTHTRFQTITEDYFYPLKASVALPQLSLQP